MRRVSTTDFVKTNSLILITVLHFAIFFLSLEFLILLMTISILFLRRFNMKRASIKVLGSLPILDMNEIVSSGQMQDSGLGSIDTLTIRKMV